MKWLLHLRGTPVRQSILVGFRECAVLLIDATEDSKFVTYLPSWSTTFSWVDKINKFFKTKGK